MSIQRSEKVQEALRQEISRIVHGELNDPRLGFITITGVQLTRDLRYAKVYFSVLGEAKDNSLALKGLNSAKGYIKGLIGDRIGLRFTPEIDFRIDEFFDEARKIRSVLDILKNERSEKDETGDRGDKRS